MNARRAFLLLFALVLFALFAALGRWQYGRGLEKQRYLQSWEQALQAPARSLAGWPDAAVTEPQPIADRLPPVRPARWLLLDNQRRGEQVGLRAYALLALADGRAVLADFGWTAFTGNRQLPTLPPLDGEVEVRGLLVPWPGQGIQLGENPWTPGAAPVLLTTLQRSEIERASGRPLLDGVLRLQGEALPGFVREVEALPNTLPAEKHFGYALQWFGLAAAVVVVSLLLWRRSTAR